MHGRCRTNAIVIALSLVAVVLAASSCASGQQNPGAAAGATASTAPISTARISSAPMSTAPSIPSATPLAEPSLSIPEDAVTYSPPPANTTARISAHQAFRTCATGDSVCGPGAPDSVTLALVTAEHTASIGKDGETHSTTVTDRLAYVFEWATATCSPVGPARPSSSTSMTPRTSAATCHVVAVVDARTGQNLFSYDDGN